MAELLTVNLSSQSGFPLSENEEKSSLPQIFPMLLEKCNSFSSVLNLNQAVTHEASIACQFYESEKPSLPVRLKTALSR